MSYDPNTDNAPIGNMEQPKPKKKWWLFTGLGCAVFLVVCCGGGGLIGYFYLGKPMQELQGTIRESQEFARNSEVVAGAVGSPVAVADQPNDLIPKTYQEDGISIQEMRFAVTGSTAKGDLILKIGQPEAFKFVRQSLVLELEDGTIIELNPDEEFSLDIDLGDGEETGSEDDGDGGSSDE